MKYSAVLFAGLAAAGYIPSPSSSAAPSTSSAPAYGGHGYGDYSPKSSSSSSSSSSAKGDYGYWPKSSSSSVKAYVPSSSKAPYKPTYTTFECEGPTTFTYNSKTYSATSATSWVVECEETETPVVPVKPSYTPKETYPAAPVYTPSKPVYTPSASVTKTGPLQVTANAAVNNVAGAGAALAGVFGAVAYLL